MKFFIRHREWFKGMAIASFVSLNLFMIAACWTGEDGAWLVTFIVAGMGIVCSLISQFIQECVSEEEKEASKEKEVKSAVRHNIDDI